MRAVGSNLITFFLFVSFLVITSSCNKDKYDVIPDVYVDFTIRFDDPQFWNISTPTTSVIVTSDKMANWTGSIGYDNNGIIVYNSGDEFGHRFYAYDRTCPNCYKNAALSIIVNTDGGYTAVCPECGTTYLLPSNGTPTAAGPGNYMLKNYHTDESLYSVRVWNRGD
jgi:hypothetical protein